MAKLERIPWWRYLPVPWYRWAIVMTVEAADEIPERIPQSSAILVAEPGQAKWIAFSCPCKRGHIVMLNVDGRRYPHWTVDEGKRLTLSPSVNDHSIDNGCHYFIRNGRVDWVPYNDKRGQHDQNQ